METECVSVWGGRGERGDRGEKEEEGEKEETEEKKETEEKEVETEERKERGIRVCEGGRRTKKKEEQSKN